MNKHGTLYVILAAVFFGLSTAGPLASAAEHKSTSSAPSDAEIRELQREISALQKQLDELARAKESQSRQRMVQQNWQSMLDYMQEMQSMPWMMHGPGMGPGMMGRGRMGWHRHGDWMMGCPMVGGPGGGWDLPSDVEAEQYSSQMQQHMQRMHDQMATIRATPDRDERQRLLQKHWQDMYRHMQTMRGMGWMWGGPMAGGQTTTPLPDPRSRGAKLVSKYCTQCHAEPSPKLHTASEWEAVTSRMEMNMQNFRKGNWRGVKMPSKSEMKRILDYMKKYAR